ncbi:MAG: hypothetical protein KKA36_02355 [Gammaproteobacteria bacterium]|nr:hypothetical protein [Gammaproteobacteria bacterium]MBU2477905.1 hypothetical protein [Gammaproteobacteria bacterium]
MTGSDLEAELPSKACDLKVVWKGIQGESWDIDCLQELHRLLYSYAGSGSSFSLQDLSTHAHAFIIELSALQHAENRYV